VRWDDAKQQWVDEGGAVNVDEKTVTTIASVSGYGAFTLARVKESNDDVEVFNAISPNDDGINEYFYIKNINKYPKNSVMIYNRWGVKVFETSNYDSNGNYFNGYSQGRATISPNSLLPEGTYFYILEYDKAKSGEQPNVVKKAGYLFLGKK